ncbi:helix-turn-helix domain-containing protein [Magnetospirillum fulvum]|uniref:Cytoskeleton protein RodZ n=1 Tax=Magnetospirillum fulvum TaxID=1082 RepID=A0A1H6HN76_MAGFU|nr:helix-turn-helix domain-containing protein [Magnetospirillum fulvum]SEH35645.1 cytoskeleton protein RodZ [Magnetospirillum fulvum]
MDSPASDDQTPPVDSGIPPVAPAPVRIADQLAVGPTLRAARERTGRTLPECSQQLFIRLPFLEALEDGRHRDLPGGAYAAGFLRTYAEFLELDGEELVRRFRQEGAGGFTNRTELAFPSPVSEGRIPGGAVIFLGLVLAGLTYGGWYLLSSREADVAEIVPPLPERLSTMLNRQAALTGEPRATASAPTDTAAAADPTRTREDVVPPSESDDDAKPAAPDLKAPEPVQTSPAPAPVAPPPAPVAAPALPPAPVEPVAVKPDSLKTEPPKVEPVKPEPSKTDASAQAPAAVPATSATTAAPEVKAPDAASPTGKVFGAEYADSRVSLRAVADDCWVQVREMDGSILTSRLLRRGDSLRLPNRPGLSLMAGNSGALEVTVDGRRIAPLGAVGQVRRDIRLDPDRLGAGG